MQKRLLSALAVLMVAGMLLAGCGAPAAPPHPPRRRRGDCRSTPKLPKRPRLRTEAAAAEATAEAATERHRGDRRSRCRAGRRRGQGHARPGPQDDPAAQVPGHPGLRPGQPGRPGSRTRNFRTPRSCEFLGPTPENSVAGQIEIVTNAATQGVKAIMISNNAGDQIVPGRQGGPRRRHDRRHLGLADPLRRRRTALRRPGRLRRDRQGDGRHGAQHPGRRRRQVRHPLRLARRGQPERLDRFAWRKRSRIRSTPSSKLLDIVYGNDQSEDSYNQALALVDKYPDMELIMAPTSVGIVAAAKAMQDEGLCETVKVSGLGLPAEMARVHDERLRA